MGKGMREMRDSFQGSPTDDDDEPHVREDIEDEDFEDDREDDDLDDELACRPGGVARAAASYQKEALSSVPSASSSSIGFV